MNCNLRYGISLFLFFCTLCMNAQVTFVPNQNQWSEDVLFQSDIQSGRAFFGENKVTYVYYSNEDLNRDHNELPDSVDVVRAEDEDAPVRCFAFEVEFVDAQQPTLAGTDPKKHRVNYFTGNDPSHWANDVPVYEKLNYRAIYPGVDIQYYGTGSKLKYDFIVAPGSEPSQIRMRYNGQRSIRMDGENLSIDLGFMQVKEVIPSSYQVHNGVKQEVKCRFLLSGNEVTFVFPDGFDAQLPLIIDPVVMASTFSGGTCHTRGFCSTYDDQGNIYAAGICYSVGFPVTLGAYNITFSGGRDIGISKYNPDGSSLLFCTYLGGTALESPHSMIVQNGNLYLFGTSWSTDFPVTAQAYSQALNGGGFCDLVVCCLSTSGSTLTASTYIGGNWTDGLNMMLAYRSDGRKGEIIIAANGDVLVANCALSQNFPTTPGAYRTTSTGGQDAVVFRMNASLSSLIWSTYIGSGVHDVAYGIREGKDGSIFVCGTSNNYFTPFPTVPGCYMTTAGGASDAFVIRLSSDGSALLSGTYIGGAGRDIAYFLDIDSEGDVYVFGEAKNAVATSGAYAIPGAKNFIAKFDPALTTLHFCSVVGSGSVTSMSAGGPPPTPPDPDPHTNYTIPRATVVPTAFRVDKCKRIYFCGFGADEEWPLTPDALYSFAGDYQFYAGVLEENATDLLSSTFYAGYHTDGGMGRIDEHGILYQAACIGGTYFPTTANAFSDGSVAADFDVCVFKIDLHIVLTKDIVIPNIFTPNGDGINDRYIPQYVLTDNYVTRIYDRYGTQVFSSSDQNETWDGKYHGNDCAEGVYYCVIEYEVCFEMKEKTGFLHLQR